MGIYTDIHSRMKSGIFNVRVGTKWHFIISTFYRRRRRYITRLTDVTMNESTRETRQANNNCELLLLDCTAVSAFMTCAAQRQMYSYFYKF